MLPSYCGARWSKLLISAMAFLMTAVTVLTIVDGKAIAAPKCKSVVGFVEEEQVTPPPSLTTRGPVIGGIQGEYRFTLINILDSATPGVSFFNGHSSIETKQGTLYFSEAGALTLASPGNFADLMTITGGTDAFAGAFGQIFLFGNFDLSTGTGASDYKGIVCTP